MSNWRPLTDEVKVPSGVFQGSLLNSILFPVMVNDLRDAIFTYDTENEKQRTSSGWHPRWHIYSGYILIYTPLKPTKQVAAAVVKAHTMLTFICQNFNNQKPDIFLLCYSVLVRSTLKYGARRGTLHSTWNRKVKKGFQKLPLAEGA